MPRRLTTLERFASVASLYRGLIEHLPELADIRQCLCGKLVYQYPDGHKNDFYNPTLLHKCNASAPKHTTVVSPGPAAPSAQPPSLKPQNPKPAGSRRTNAAHIIS